MHKWQLDMPCFAFTSGARALLIMLILQGIQCLCFASNSKWYLTSNGAKDGIFGALRLVSCFKGPSLISQHHLVNIISYISYLSICASYHLNSQHICRGSKLINLIDAFECAFHMFACMAQVLNSIYMLVWCMLVIGLNDERETSMHRIVRYALVLFFKWYQSLA